MSNFHPEKGRHSAVNEHQSNFVHDCLILSFQYPILLECADYIKLSNNAVVLEIYSEFSRHEFSTLVKPHTESSMQGLLLYHCMELLKHFKRLIFCNHEVDL